MKLIETHKIKPDTFEGQDSARHWVYCGLDTCLTIEIFDAISPQLDNITNSTYRFSMDLMGPCLEMNMRGVLIDPIARDKAVELYKKDLQHVTGNLNTILIDGLGLQLNWNSHQQLKHLFYEVMGLPPIKKRNSKGEWAPTVDRDALEKLAESYFVAKPIISHILVAKDIAKKISVLTTEIDEDGRIRTSFNIGGTDTGRLSSSLSDFGTGTNLQNVEERLRRVFIADPGYKFTYIDLEQAESRAVGAIIWNEFHDGTYLDACESSDLHTYVARLAFPELAWTGDLKKDKLIAEQPFYRQHSYRHMAKVLGHGSNYSGQPGTMEKHTKISRDVIKGFQTRYFTAFPFILKWHEKVEQTIRHEGKMTNLMGRKRHFFGRRNDPTTHRAAIAYDPQGSVANILNTGMLRLWRARLSQLLLQVHDAVLTQHLEGDEDNVVPKECELLKIPIELSYGRTLVIPSEALVGWNWAKATQDNPNGLVKFYGHDQRQRWAASQEAQILVK